MKQLLILTILILSGTRTLNGFYIDGFKPNENSSVIDTLTITYDETNQASEFPNIFKVKIINFIDQEITFNKISKDDYYPVSSDDIYTSDSNKRVQKVEIPASFNETFEVYRSEDGKSVATLIKNSDVGENNQKYRMLATIQIEDSSDLIYNILPIIEVKTSRKRILTKNAPKYDSQLNSHAIVKGNMRDLKFETQIKKDINVKTETIKSSRVKRSINGQPINLFVEYLVVVDPSVYNDQMSFAGTTNQNLVLLYMKAYFAHYVNAINQRFQNSFVNDPDIRLTIKFTNLLILTSTSNSQWTNSSIVGVLAYPTYNGRQVIVANLVLSAFASYMNGLSLNFTYDHAIGLFNKDLWGASTGLPSDLTNTLGYSPIGGICSSSRYSISEEIGGFRYTVVAAHELGHNLGAYHDGLLVSQGGDLYSGSCNQSDNYLMTASLGLFPNNLLNNLKLSSCSILSIKSEILTDSAVSQNAMCLMNAVGVQSTDYLTDNILPGQFFTANDQCKAAYGSSSSFCQGLSASMCTTLYCRNSTGTCISVGVGAAPGTTCGSGTSCIQGVCTNGLNAPTSTCPFGDDVIYRSDIQLIFAYLQLPSLPKEQMNCEEMFSFYSQNNYSISGLCQDSRSSVNFRKLCCATCKKYDSLICADTLYNCPINANNGVCNFFTTVNGVNKVVSAFCPRSCNTCQSTSAQLKCTDSTYLCQNGGTCTNITVSQSNLTGFSCSCPTGFTGSLCEIDDPCLPNPCQNNGICQQFGSLGYICLCSNGFYGYNCSLTNGTTALSGSTTTLSGSTITLSGSTITLSGSTATTSGSSITTSTGSTTAATAGLTTTGLVTATTKTSTTTTAASTVCLTNPCKNDGNCTANSASTYSCSCLTGFSGTNCQTSSINCLATPCQNGATCVNDPINQSYYCRCTPGFSGKNCQINYICYPNPCLNGGSCIQISNTAAYCKCAPGYSGGTCQTSNPCRSSPCQNQATCTTLGTNQYQCSCTSGFYGVNCENPVFNPCVLNNSPVCLNGAVCAVTNSSPFYSCTCTSGYSGTNCQNIVTTTQAPIINCVDTNPTSCQVYAINNFCKPYFYVYGVSVPKYCPKSCNVCISTTTTTSSPCSDLYTECTNWANLQYCKFYPIFNYCKKSCNLCS